ncbi:hypothetical protein GEMRC1_011580 [Eukaryota sp. GEM-RC1]
MSLGSEPTGPFVSCYISHNQNEWEFFGEGHVSYAPSDHRITVISLPNHELLINSVIPSWEHTSVEPTIFSWQTSSDDPPLFFALVFDSSDSTKSIVPPIATSFNHILDPNVFSSDYLPEDIPEFQVFEPEPLPLPPVSLDVLADLVAMMDSHIGIYQLALTFSIEQVYFKNLTSLVLGLIPTSDDIEVNLSLMDENQIGYVLNYCFMVRNLCKSLRYDFFNLLSSEDIFLNFCTIASHDPSIASSQRSNYTAQLSTINNPLNFKLSPEALNLYQKYLNVNFLKDVIFSISVEESVTASLFLFCC